MGRLYSIPFSFTVTAAGGDCDILNIQPAADKPVRLRGLRLGQMTDFKDANEVGMKLAIRRFTATVTNGSGGAALTPVRVDPDDTTAAGATVRGNDATVATTTGTNELREYLDWNVRNMPLEVWWTTPGDEDTAPKCSGNANRLILRLETALAADVAVDGTAWIEEG